MTPGATKIYYDYCKIMDNRHGYKKRNGYGMDDYIVIELDKMAFQRLKFIIDPVKLFVNGDFHKTNFVVGEFLFTYKEGQ